MLICFVRHGETDWNKEQRIQGRKNVPLNKKGIEQAKICASYLKRGKWDIVFSSPLARALKTAEIIAEDLLLGPVLEDIRLIERDYGIREGKSRYEYVDLCQYEKSQETLKAVQKRMLAFLEMVEKTFEHKNVIIVSHGTAIGALFDLLFQEENSEIPNGGIFLLEWVRGEYKRL